MYLAIFMSFYIQYLFSNIKKILISPRFNFYHANLDFGEEGKI